jgi:hypothetical protein
MGWLEIMIAGLFFGVFLLGIIVYFSIEGSQPVEFNPFVNNVSGKVYVSEEQFFPNMRFPNREISYFVEDKCDDKKKARVVEAFSILSSETILIFYPSNPEIVPEINILCSDKARKTNKTGHYVAGEGGPTKVINTSAYFVILEGEISLFRDESCAKPQIATHEILHALGFDHNNNKRSILYPTSGCNQVIDEYIPKRINELYSFDAAPDLVIDKADARKRGSFVDFDVEISNQGLVNSGNATLLVLSEGKELADYDLGDLDVGIKKSFSVKNLKSKRSSDEIEFYVETRGGLELDYANNHAKLIVG